MKTSLTMTVVCAGVRGTVLLGKVMLGSAYDFDCIEPALD